MSVCLICHSRIISTTYLDMLNHYNNRCRFMLQSMSDSSNLDEIITQYDGEDVQFFNHSAVSYRELDAQRKLYVHHKVYTSIAGFKCKYQPSCRGLERMIECQQCMKTWKKPKPKNLSIHRYVFLKVLSDSLK